MKTLAEWLDYQQHLHAFRIDMGLDRVREVWQRMGARRPAPVVVTVAGTNGKGSTVAMLEAMLHAGGMRTGTYTSPHIVRYNERVSIDGIEADDAELVAAFARVEAARGDVALTYFEFGTLAALDLFVRARLDAAVLEVGMGGRLDAVNVIDADCAVVVTVDLDHMEYLGPDREAIGHEKAGVFRAGRPAIIGESAPPRSVLEHANDIGARVEILGRDFGVRREAGALAWWRREGAHAGDAGTGGSEAVGATLHEPLILEGGFQLRNAATAIAALSALGDRVRWDAHALEARSAGTVAAGLLAGRLQHLSSHPDVVVDVGHNPQAAGEIARWLDAHPTGGALRAVYGALRDKDVEGVVARLGRRVQRWYLAGLEDESPRGESVESLARRVRAALPDAACSTYPDVARALAAARAAAAADDRVLAFGSFHVVAPVLRGLGRV